MAEIPTVQPGDVIHVTNQKDRPMRIRVVTACCATETVAFLHPGARLELTAGRSRVDIFMADEDYSGLHIVRPAEES
jgi:hypothetical protein